MAEFNPNDDQKKAINTKGCNILVSAAAGSGKTTVLVERVIKMVIEEAVDIDSLIIMTFTKAAAASMKAKIYSRIRKALAEDDLPEPVIKHLQRQLIKTYSARICTIDSLCMDIVKENFQNVDVDPGFQIADEANIAMMKTDLLAEILEEHYADPDETFLKLVSFYTDKNDSKIENLILSLLRFAESHPSPERWMDRLAASYESARTLNPDFTKEENKWLLYFAQIINSKLETAYYDCEKGLAICDRNYGPFIYRDNFEALKENLKSALETSFDGKSNILAEILTEWKNLPRGKKAELESIDKEIKEEAGELYKKIKADLKKIKDSYFYQSLEDMYREMGECAPVVRELVDLAGELKDRLLKEKKERNIYSFNDVAHFALDILISYDEEGNAYYTETADRIAKETTEIIVDEYQDTNRLQDALVKALSAERFGRPNLFMVGDVKQSIYGFRMACPDLFIEKYNSYEERDNCERIILGQNYRSRKEVVDFTNLIFSQAMIPELGGIDYNDANQLIYGAEYSDAEFDMTPEVIMIDGSGENAKIAEAMEIAGKIESLVNQGQATYADIAILTRNTDNPFLEQCLRDRSIPMVKSTNKGFFQTFEIRLALNLIRIIDNPYQDIPFAAVLTSPMVGFDANDLARIKINYEGEKFSLYEGSKAYAEKNRALADFMEKLEMWRERSNYFDTERFLRYVLDDSGLFNILLSMPQGEVRKANIEFLMGLVKNFSTGTYVGLFNFIRYVQELQKEGVDFGQGQTASSGMNAVQIMTIHKSKGLEFPIVFLANAGKNYNETDERQAVVLDADLGLGIEFRDVEERLKKNTLLMETVKEKKKRDAFAEEMRLLYVALTRAKEKLFITGANQYIKGRAEKWERKKELNQPMSVMTVGEIMSDNNFLWILGDCMVKRTEVPFNWNIKNIEEIEEERVLEIIDTADKKRALDTLISEGTDSGTDIFSYIYPYEEATKTQVKMTASQLEQKDEVTKDDFFEDAREQKIQEEFFNKSFSGAERGTAYHKVFELLDYNNPDVKGQIASMENNGFISKEIARKLKPEHFITFMESDLGKRMRTAFNKGFLKREQQFVMGIEENGELRLIQGIIDAFFEEDGKIILVDYKTDRNSEEEHYRSVYAPQQEAYAKAIEAAKGKPVEEILLYSTEMGREIRLK